MTQCMSVRFKPVEREPARFVRTPRWAGAAPVETTVEIPGNVYPGRSHPFAKDLHELDAPALVDIGKTVMRTRRPSIWPWRSARRSVV